MNGICHHIGLFTDNPQELIKFYADKFAFEVGETKTLPEIIIKKIFGISISCTLTKLKLNQVILEIISPENLELKKRTEDVSGYNHWSLGVKDSKIFAKALQAKDVDIVKIESKGRAIFFVKDPDGNLIEIYEV